ncbi:hypothetical protein TIFTF001_017053 [Ficus carica]|uniref:Uncharacterized protein n=1 Tax=Ficus carica TaxID=3494 RepID=A0AA88ATX2_FICCA|nr:hypothetical protein TIFTF001_017053 [Ficus carica]
MRVRGFVDRLSRILFSVSESVLHRRFLSLLQKRWFLRSTPSPVLVLGSDDLDSQGEAWRGGIWAAPAGEIATGNARWGGGPG